MPPCSFADAPALKCGRVPKPVSPAPIPVFPASRQPHGGKNEARHRIGLPEIPPQLASLSQSLVNSIQVVQPEDEVGLGAVRLFSHLKQAKTAREIADMASSRLDVAAGASLGALLGLLVGLSGSPIVSSVVTGLVALLAGLFGFSDKISPNPTIAATRRIVAFGLAALIATPAAVYIRTHDWLAPSVAAQRVKLLEIGIQDKKDQDVMLRFLYLGVLPPGYSAVPKLFGSR